MNLLICYLGSRKPELMGILRDTINRQNDVRIEKIRYIETLKETRSRQESILESAGTIASEFVNRSLALLFLVAASPILLLVSIWIKLDSPGPLFFRQERMGKNGHTFFITKFRTMISDAEKTTGPILARMNDDRVTRAGRILRHFRIDEIPQMFNVLTGHMALVGPRPERPEIYDDIVQDWPEFFKRLEVKPGITGLAQIRGDYHTNPRDKLRYDMLYMEKKSLWVDAKIIATTAYICFLGRGSC